MEGNDTYFFGLGEDITEADQGLSEEGLENLIAVQTPLQEETHSHLAVEIAKRVKYFQVILADGPLMSMAQSGMPRVMTSQT